MATITSKSAPKLPRGLWVGKILKKCIRARPDIVLQPGKRPWDLHPDDYSEQFYFRVAKKGLAVVNRCAETGDYKEAVRRARAYYDTAVAAKWNKTIGAAEVLRSGRRQTCSMGAIFAAYEGGPAFAKDRRRIVQTCRLVVAIAKGWTVAGGQITEKSDLARRIDALGAEDVLTREMVRDYFKASQGGEYKPSLRSRDHITVNKRLNFARQLFTKRARQLCYDDVALPDIDGFMTFPYLMESKPDLEDEMITPEAYTAMLDAAAALEYSADPADREMALVNRLLRELGLRTGELVAARGSWLVQDARTGQWYFDVRDRPEEGYEMKGVEPGKLPLSPALLALLLPRREAAAGEHLILPGETPTRRSDLCRDAHNAWLKKLVGTVRSRKGNHRLRKYVATMLAEVYGVDVASHYLRHAGEAVTLKNYIAKRKERLTVVDSAALRAWSAPEATTTTQP